jgi:hypothetical protein
VKNVPKNARPLRIFFISLHRDLLSTSGPVPA